MPSPATALFLDKICDGADTVEPRTNCISSAACSGCGSDGDICGSSDGDNCCGIRGNGADGTLPSQGTAGEGGVAPINCCSSLPLLGKSVEASGCNRRC